MKKATRFGYLLGPARLVGILVSSCKRLNTPPARRIPAASFGICNMQRKGVSIVTPSKPQSRTVAAVGGMSDQKKIPLRGWLGQE